MEKKIELQKVEKVLRALPTKFVHIIIVITEFKYLSEVKL